MSKVAWKDIEMALGERNARQAMPDAPTFREDFKARARLVRQSEPEVVTSATAVFARWGLASAAIAAAVLIAVGYWVWPVGGSLVTHVKALKVLAPYSGVIIMDDEGGKGTVVWITDLDSDGGDKG